MPELPEVETVVRTLNKHVIGRTITAVWFDWPKLVKDPLKQSRLVVSKKAVLDFRKNIIGKKIVRAERVAKNILIYLSSDASGRAEADYVMLVHQKMSGHLLLGRWKLVKGAPVALAPKEMVEDSMNGYIRLILYLENGEMIALSDLRRFAKVLFGPTKIIKTLPELLTLGPDALDPKLKPVEFSRRVRSSGRAIKTVLLDPGKIAGIGNIYSDDALWHAQISPSKPANQLTDAEAKNLFLAVRRVLRKAVRLRGTTIGDFRDPYGQPGGYAKERVAYHRHGEACGRCGVLMVRQKIGGRSAHFCPKCQKL
ncbi:MAG: hypothetical protein COU11_03245 [Candidatus Harrisonbacteria bacterium CG10_big_fil_rev_8_21_14_0_10_49_15]|uniref:DNA-formamidopyrimidine glycosylase n=1 Tax=Candidatus Harrisonbacteria bacterium CG10_big_fil_rev_8_21_14_0_10_49_15 TaxID=1974587 RepID=A0A2H0UM43_9BACT|nr:MAG: hypothetical protein COU11_03245 [Candidatus Harrisonbacteria bacterium CG10_big_fil_rev_8_21_14_0_10_49_15]